MSDDSRLDTTDLLKLEPYATFLANCRSSNTRDGYYQDLRILHRFFRERSIYDPSQAKPADLVRFAAHLTQKGATPTGKPRDPYSTRSMKRILAAVRSFYQYLAAIQAIQSDPTVVFKTLPIRTPHRNPRPLSPSDREALVLHLRTEGFEDLRVSTVVRLGYECGLRVSEICGLKVADLDLIGRDLTVIGKGDKQRTVPMLPILADLLKRLIERTKSEWEVEGTPYVFPSPRNEQKPMNPQHLEIWVKRAAEWAGLERASEMTVHVLRHTFGTQLAESGASVYEIRDLMGHSSIVVSENYVKLASESAKNAHRKAFGAGSKTHPLRLSSAETFLTLLRTIRRRRRGSA